MLQIEPSCFSGNPLHKTEHNSPASQRAKNDAQIGAKDGIVKRLVRRHQLAADFDRNAAMIRFNRMVIVCTQPAIDNKAGPVEHRQAQRIESIHRSTKGRRA